MELADFNETSHYLPILNSVLFIEIIFIYLATNYIIIKSNYLKLWYAKYHLSALIADVLIIMIVIILTRYLYPIFFNKFSLIKFIILALIIQIIHDYIFYLFFKNYPRGQNQMIDIFKDYANEVSYNAIIGDSLMIIFSCLIGYYYIQLNTNTNIIILIVFLYILQYLINK